MRSPACPILPPAVLKPFMTRPSEWTAELDECLGQALIESLNVARCNAAPAKPSEVDFVFGIFQRGLRRIHDDLQHLAPRIGMRASVAGVFCHQTPRVKASTWSEGCELGDLLFIVQFKPHAAAAPLSNALLLQFKVDEVELKGAEPQTDLYLRWPTFRITRGYASGEAHRSWNVSAPKPHAGAQYGLINTRDDTLSAIPLCECLDPTCTRRSLAWELTDTVDFSSGRAFAGTGPTAERSDWNELIWHLLRHTAAQRLTLKSSGVAPRGYPRGTGSTLCLLRAFDTVVPDALLYAMPSLADAWAELTDTDNEFWGTFEEAEGGNREPPLETSPTDANRNEGGISVVTVTLAPEG